MKIDYLLFKFTSVVFVAIVVAGCSDPKAANEKNFKASIQQYLDTAYPKCYVRTEFPTTIEWDFVGIKSKLRALAKAGWVIEKEGGRETPILGGGKETVSTFDLTEEGRKFYKADIEKTIGGKTIGGFCFGKARIKDVTQFSEPSDMFGQRITHVNYTYEVYDLPVWTKTPEITAAFDNIKGDVETEKTPAKALDVLVLTNNGWVHEKLFKK
ncbi:MAG: hypothetical protein PHC94_07440 [Methylobacter sp.]|nr:hypothetical protein [Methylobacter sp.]